MTDTLAGKTLFITGASRGIGKAIALRAAADGANIAIAAKSAEPHPRLEGTIHSAAAEIEAAGGKALPIKVDIRDEHQIVEAAAKTAEHFGGIDILVNNASAISLTGTLETPMRRVDLMFAVNVRGTDAARQILLARNVALTGRFLIDDEVLAEASMRDFNRYAVQPGTPLAPDLFLD